MKYKQLVSKYMYILLYVIDGEVEKGGPTMFDFIDFVLTKYIMAQIFCSTRRLVEDFVLDI